MSENFQLISDPLFLKCFMPVSRTCNRRNPSLGGSVSRGGRSFCENALHEINQDHYGEFEPRADSARRSLEKKRFNARLNGASGIRRRSWVGIGLQRGNVGIRCLGIRLLLGFTPPTPAVKHGRKNRTGNHVARAKEERYDEG